MYIKYKGWKYPCQCWPGAEMVYHGLPDDFPVPVKGEITLHADDGFALRTDKVEDYLRQTFASGTLVLTNRPEAEPEPESDPEPTELEQLRADVDYIAIMTGVEL